MPHLGWYSRSHINFIGYDSHTNVTIKKLEMYLKNGLVMLCTESAVLIQSTQINEQLKCTAVGKNGFNVSKKCWPNSKITESETK
jgi:hypothetical protein